MRIDLSPLLRGAHARDVQVAGVRIGAPAANIERTAVTHAEPAPGEPAPWGGGDPYRGGPSPEPAERSLAELIDATIRWGGFLRCGDLALRVADGAIERIFVRGPSLASLGIGREQDIATRFGSPAGHERKLGWRLHHYPRRALAIAWHAREERVEHVALGVVEWVEPRLGARELLAEVLAAFVPLQPAWTRPPGGVARARFERIAALARALGLGTLRNLVDGDFLDEALLRHPARRAVLEELAARGDPPDLRGPLRPSSAATLFTQLLCYRGEVDRVVRATSGWLVCGDAVLLGMIATQDRLGRQIEALMADIDRWLCTLIDPEGRTFELRELIARHGWPDVDLHELELDEL